MLRFTVALLASFATPLLAAETLPPEIQGTWGRSAKDCAMGLGAEGILTITETEVQFYESTGTVAAIEQATPDGVIAAYRFSGEGETWEKRMFFSADNTGSLLIRIDIGETQGAPITYQTCD